MEILLAFITYGENVFAGMERSVFNMRKSLEREGHSVKIYTGEHFKPTVQDDSVFYSKILLTDFQTNDISHSIRSNILDHKIEIIDEINILVDVHDIDYILTVDQLWGILTVLGEDTERIKAPIGILFHMLFDVDLIIQSLKLNLSHYFCISEFIYNEIRTIAKHNDLVTNKKISILYNMLNESEYKPPKLMNYEIQNEKVRIFYNARISKEKGIVFFIDAMDILGKKYKNIEVVLCKGDFHFGNAGDLFDYISSKTNINIIYLPKINWNKVWSVINSSDIVVLTSEMETFGYAILEAMYAKKPVVVSNVGNLPNLVGCCAPVVEYGNVEALVLSIEKLIVSDRTREEIGKKLFDRYSRYSSKIQIDELITKISEVL